MKIYSFMGCLFFVLILPDEGYFYSSFFQVMFDCFT